MHTDAAPKVIEGWRCECSIEDSAENDVIVIARFTPQGADPHQLELGRNPKVELRLDIGACELQRASKLTWAYASRGMGRNMAAFGTFNGVNNAAVRAIVVHFAGVDTRIEVVQREGVNEC